MKVIIGMKPKAVVAPEVKKALLEQKTQQQAKLEGLVAGAVSRLQSQGFEAKATAKTVVNHPIGFVETHGILSVKKGGQHVQIPYTIQVKRGARISEARLTSDSVLRDKKLNTERKFNLLVAKTGDLTSATIAKTIVTYLKNSLGKTPAPKVAVVKPVKYVLTKPKSKAN